MIVIYHKPDGMLVPVETPDAPLPYALATPEAQDALINAIVAVFAQNEVAWDADVGICKYAAPGGDGSVCRCVVGHFTKQWQPEAWVLIEGRGISNMEDARMPADLKPNDLALLQHLQRAHDAAVEAADEGTDDCVPNITDFRIEFASALQNECAEGRSLFQLRCPILDALERVRVEQPGVF